MGYLRAEFVLKGFVRFICDRYGERSVSLERAVTEWVVRIDGRKAITVGNEFGIVRQLCLFRRRSDPRCFVPDHALAPVKESVFVPYIFSREVVLALVNAVTRHEGRRMWGPMLRALTLVLYCTGMRLGEAAVNGGPNPTLNGGARLSKGVNNARRPVAAGWRVGGFRRDRRGYLRDCLEATAGRESGQAVRSGNASRFARVDR
ncbi:hypothetical protein [Cupriavidus sp. SK-3]|uniref:hypothetical protein n=1 Tax=Cupriavidus sp. SK-3 TaxID=1470558 RepID=UPI001268E971|nr:hypothetical protein [Cupriavidus sp. SK-3]